MKLKYELKNLQVATGVSVLFLAFGASATSLGVKSGEKVGKRACSPTVGLGQHGAKGIQATSEEAFGGIAVPEAA